MKHNFGIKDLEFEVDTVVVEYPNSQTPLESLEVIPLSGPLEGKTFYIGGFEFEENYYENGDSRAKYHVHFKDSSQEEDDILISENSGLITHIAQYIITEAYAEAQEQTKNQVQEEDTDTTE